MSNFRYFDWDRTAQVLVVDGDQRHAESLCVGLSRQGLKARVFSSPEQAAQRLRRPSSDYGIVILNISNLLPNWVKVLAKLQAACFESGVYPLPLFLCVSTIKQLPELELRIERMGARYVFEG